MKFKHFFSNLRKYKANFTKGQIRWPRIGQGSLNLSLAIYSLLVLWPWSDSNSDFGPIHVVEQLYFFMISSILTFKIGVILGLFLCFGPNGLSLGLG